MPPDGLGPLRGSSSAARVLILSNAASSAAASTFSVAATSSGIVVNQLTTIPELVAATEKVLAAALDAAFDKIKTLAADELPRSGPNPSGGIAGSALWLQVAQAEEAAGVTETSAPDRIRSYFAAVPQNVGEKTPAWCGAFAAFCMKTTGNPVPAAPALALNSTRCGSLHLSLASHNTPPPS